MRRKAYNTRSTARFASHCDRLRNIVKGIIMENAFKKLLDYHEVKCDELPPFGIDSRERFKRHNWIEIFVVFWFRG